MIEGFAEYAIAHEAGHAVLGQFVKVNAPKSISFWLNRDPSGGLYLGDFATSFPFPPDDQIPALPDPVKKCLCYMLAAGLAATQLKELSLPDENHGLGSDRSSLAKITSDSLEAFVPYARAILKQELRAFDEIIEHCRGRYEALKTQAVVDGKHVLATSGELEAIFKRAMTPSHAPFPIGPLTEEVRETMSAHEAGHATTGITLGARIEAVYGALSKLPDGNVRVLYMTKFGAFGRAGLGMREKVLLTAGGAAGEVLLMGSSADDYTHRDRSDLAALGFGNFDYCVKCATELLKQNTPLLNAVRQKIRERLADFKHCKVTKKGTHVVLAKGAEIEKVFRTLGFRVEPNLDLDLARAKPEEAAKQSP